MSPFARLTRRIAAIGWVLLGCGLAAFVWAMVFTTGVEPLVNGLLVSFVGFAIPSGFVFWIAWAIDRTERPDDDPEHALRARTAGDRPLWLRVAFALAAAALGVGARVALGPILGDRVPYAPLFVAVAAAAWFGGAGPGLLATFLGGAGAWYFVVPPRGSFAGAGSADVVGMGIFVAIATTGVAMIAALRASQVRSRALVDEVRARQVALEESEARFRTVADEVPALIWMTDESGSCTYVNRGVVEFTGRAAPQLRGEGWTAAVHPEDLPEVRERVARAFRAREAFAIEFRLRRGDGAYRTMRDEGRPRFDRDGRFLGFIGVSVDVTARQHAGGLAAR